MIGNVYLCYPYVETVGKDASKLKINVPAVQNQGTEYSFFYGSQTIVEATPAHFDLKSTFAVLELSISTNSYGVGNALSEITVSATDAKLTGDFDVDLTVSNVVAKVNEAYIYGNAATLKMSGDAAILKADAPVKARIVINPDQLEGKDLSIVVKMGEDSWSFTEAGRNFLANKVYPITLSINAPAVNLNRTERGMEYANCYMVNQPNTLYKFDAKVQGNGKATAGITPQAIEPKSVFVVWESTTAKGGVIKDVQLSTDGFVTFSTSDQIGGNALIAVTDGVPTEELTYGKILWSWHIWGTDYVLSNDKKITTTENNEFYFMDINLGALKVEPDVNGNGLKYQWGRKDPFYNDGIPSSGVVIGNVTNYWYDQCWGADAFTPEVDNNESVIATINYPTIFFKGAAGYGSTQDWYGNNATNDALWGNVEGALGTKSIYDPCPVGYRVPPKAAYIDFKKPVDVTYADGWSFPLGDKKSFFPATSYLIFSTGIYSQGTWQGLTSSYWTSTPADNNVVILKLESTAVMLNNYGARAQGSAVRCIREQ